MVGFTLVSRSYYYLRRRSPGPPFPPDHRQAGERGANRLLKNQTVPNELRTKRHTPHGVAVTNATTRNFTKPPALAQDQESIRVVTKARGRGVPEARGTRTELKPNRSQPTQKLLLLTIITAAQITLTTHQSTLWALRCLFCR